MYNDNHNGLTDDDLPGDVTLDDCGDMATAAAVAMGDYP